MGGSGSGRYGWRGVVERRYRLHVRDFKTRGGFAPGAAGSLVWTREGGTAGSVGFTIAADRVVLRYTRLGEDAEGRRVAYDVPDYLYRYPLSLRWASLLLALRIMREAQGGGLPALARAPVGLSSLPAAAIGGATA